MALSIATSALWSALPYLAGGAHGQAAETNDPLSTVFRLAICERKPKGTKLNITDGHIYYDEPTVLQGTKRLALQWVQGDGASRNALYRLHTPLKRACCWYRDHARLERIFQDALKGLNGLKEIYHPQPGNATVTLSTCIRDFEEEAVFITPDGEEKKAVAEDPVPEKEGQQQSGDKSAAAASASVSSIGKSQGGGEGPAASKEGGGGAAALPESASSKKETATVSAEAEVRLQPALIRPLKPEEEILKAIWSEGDIALFLQIYEKAFPLVGETNLHWVQALECALLAKEDEHVHKVEEFRSRLAGGGDGV